MKIQIFGKLLQNYDLSCAAIWKRTLDKEKKSAKITNSRNAIPKFCKGVYKIG
jgi:hypothetical protein